MKIKKIILLVIACLNMGSLYSKSIFEMSTPKTFINDYANIITSDEKRKLESKVRDFESITSNQIAVVTVKTLEGMEIFDFAHKLAQQWGVGQKNKNNGVLIVIKPKYENEKGQVYIAVGYGLEGSIPDAVAKRIVENVLIRNFKANKYYEGIDEALNSIFEYTINEYNNLDSSQEAFSRNDKIIFISILIFTFILPFLYLIYLRRKRLPDNMSHFYNEGEFNYQNIIAQIEKIEKYYNRNYPKFKEQVKRYDYISKHNIFKYEKRIDDGLFCMLLNDKNRYLAFKETTDPFIIGIVSYLFILVVIISLSILFYWGIYAMIFFFCISLYFVYALINILISFLQMYIFILRKKGLYHGGLTLGLFSINCMLKRNIKKVFNEKTQAYHYIPAVVYYSSGNIAGSGGFFGGGGGGFGGGSFGGGGAGGSW